MVVVVGHTARIRHRAPPTRPHCPITATLPFTYLRAPLPLPPVGILPVPLLGVFNMIVAYQRGVGPWWLSVQ